MSVYFSVFVFVGRLHLDYISTRELEGGAKRHWWGGAKLRGGAI